MKKKLSIVLLTFILLLTACAPSGTQDINSIVQATFVALTVQAAVSNSGGAAATPIASPVIVAGTTAANTAATGSISGTLSYPSNGIPPLLIVAFNNTTGSYYWLKTAKDAKTYQLDNLPAGMYYVFAYTLPDGKMVGAYDQFYLCGLKQGCNDLSFVEVNVQAGVVTPNINPGDWYGNASQFPAMPNVDQPQNNNAAPKGSITGSLTFPASGLPGMTVVAFRSDGKPGEYYYAVTQPGNNTYQIEVPAGQYTVVAYSIGGNGFAGGLPGGYSKAVLCGLSTNCTDHSLIPVTVQAGQVTGNVNLEDWYAAPGTFPTSPVP